MDVDDSSRRKPLIRRLFAGKENSMGSEVEQSVLQQAREAGASAMVSDGWINADPGPIADAAIRVVLEELLEEAEFWRGLGVTKGMETIEAGKVRELLSQLEGETNG